MNFKEFIESLGQALGMRLENAGGACGLDVDGVTVMIHDADDLVLLTAEIGPPPPEEGLETLFSTVLRANWLYRGTGGATLAINPEDGCIWLEKYNFLERLDGEKGVEMLTRFAETARTWRDLVAGFKPDVSSGGDPSRDLAVGDFMQVQREVNAFLHSDTDQRTKDAALTLFSQCQRVLDNKAERKDSHDAFKVAARIAVLSNLIGKVPCWNCKSGKDRTGQMDVECKFLATLIARGEPIPEPGKRLSKEHQTLLRSIALEGGNFEIQKMNTAIAGFKTGSINSVTERLGGSAYRQFHRGGSDHVNV